MPKLLSFPKFLYPHLTPEALAETLRALDFDGVDILIRDSAWVKPGDLTESLPRFVRTMRDAGLAATTVSVDWSHAEAVQQEDAYRLFAEQGIEMVRIWFQPYRGAGTFHEDWEAARRNLDAIEAISRRTGVKTLIQTHMGNLVWSAETAWFMVRDCDPAAVGVHYDPGNMVYGEGWADPVKVIDILGPYLALVGIKNGGWFLAPESEQGYRLRWKPSWMPVDAGIIDYAQLLRLLHEHGYDGPFVMHNFYDACHLDGLLDATRHDVDVVRRIWKAL